MGGGGGGGSSYADASLTNVSYHSGVQAGNGIAVLAYIQPSSITNISPSVGPTTGGQSVIITGLSLSGATSVAFQGSPGVITANSLTSITVTAPAHAAGTVDVAVAVGGQTLTVSGGYTYDVPPAISAISPTAGPIAGGTAVTITGSNLLTGATVLLGGTPATNVVVVNSTTITATAASHSVGPVDLVVTNTDALAASLPQAYRYVAHGDSNGDGQVTSADVFYLINRLFAGGPGTIGSGDVNGDGSVTSADIFYLINYLFAGGPAPK